MDGLLGGWDGWMNGADSSSLFLVKQIKDDVGMIMIRKIDRSVLSSSSLASR